MITGVPSDPRGADDLGGMREFRPMPCRKTTWCTSEDGHAAACLEEPRGEHAPEDFGPEASKQRRY